LNASQHVWVKPASANHRNTIIADRPGTDDVYLVDFLASDDRLALDASGDVFGSASSGGDFDFRKTGCTGNLPVGCGVAFEIHR
jgi:hypothetical protein